MSRPRERKLRSVLALAVLGGICALTTGASPGAPRKDVGFSYGWPVKPFDQPHPIRGTFGEPRTTFWGPPLLATLLHGAGSFSYHTGIDIAVPDGTPVYPVKSGVVWLPSTRTVTVNSGRGVMFQYWHIVPTVKNGQSVTAYQTMLGRVRRGYGHVHLSQFQDRVLLNPLLPGRIGPYADTTRPRVGTITFSTTAGKAELPELLRGPVLIAAEAWDTSALPVAGEWKGFPIGPALVTSRIERARDHLVVVRDHIAFDARSTLPVVPFWHSYARGTEQNMPTFKRHRYWRELGRYVYRLTGAPFDTRRLRDGIYALVVTAVDSRGNRSSTRQVFTVRNKPGWPPPTPQG
jgi:hypothetical protein